MDKVNELISKSLDDIDNIIAQVEGNKADDISKSVGDNEEVPPEEVSNDTPADNEGAGDAGDEGGEGEPGDEGGEPTDTDEEGGDDSVEKSLEQELNANENVRKALEVSEFLSEMVKSISTVIESQRTDLNKSVQSTKDTQEIMAKSFQGMVKAQVAILGMQSDLSKSLKAINTRLAKIEAQPQVRKSAATATSAKPIEKSFAASLGGAPKADNKLTKSQASAKLFAAYNSGDAAVMNDILALEGTGDFNSLSLHGKEVLGIQ